MHNIKDRCSSDREIRSHELRRVSQCVRNTQKERQLETEFQLTDVGSTNKQ